MKKLFILLALITILVSACVPPITATPTPMTTLTPTATPLAAEKMTFKLQDGSRTEIYVINEKGQYLVKLGIRSGYYSSDKVYDDPNVSLITGEYTTKILREILSVMFPDMSEDQYVSDEMFSWFSRGVKRTDYTIGDILYLSPDQYERICNSEIFFESVTRYLDLKNDYPYNAYGYYDLFSPIVEIE